MKKLMVAAAVAAMSACLFAAEGEAAPKEGDGAQPAPQAAEAAPRAPRPGFNRAQFEERLKKRQEERRAKVAEILKAAGLPEDKVGAAVDEIDKVYTKRPQRPQRPAAHNGQRRRPAQRPQGAPAQQ